MRASVAAPLLLLVACAASGPARRPLAVLYVDEPWSRGDVASASPLVALYDDGLVLYQDGPGDDAPRYVRAVLDVGERSALEGSLTPGLFDLDASYDLFAMPHHPFNVLHVWRDGGRKTITVYGALDEASGLRAQCPPAFLEAFDALQGLRLDRATPWRPDALLVTFQGQDAVSEPRPWPKDWPGLSDTTTRRLDGASEIELDYGHLAELAALWEHPRNSHAPVVIDGRRGLVTYRVALPCHEAWEEAGER